VRWNLFYPIRRYVGVRDFDGRLTIDPHRPRRFRALGFSLRFHNRQLRVRFSDDEEEYRLEEDDDLEVVISGIPRRLSVGAPVRTRGR
jgi:trehalose/maltose hydrolase-like predicted phosphorylase